MSVSYAQESTESAAMLSTSSREGAQGTPIYTYDYKVSSGQTCQHGQSVNARKQAAQFDATQHSILLRSCSCHKDLLRHLQDAHVCARQCMCLTIEDCCFLLAQPP